MTEYCRMCYGDGSVGGCPGCGKSADPSPEKVSPRRVMARTPPSPGMLDWFCSWGLSVAGKERRETQVIRAASIPDARQFVLDRATGEETWSNCRLNYFMASPLERPQNIWTPHQ